MASLRQVMPEPRFIAVSAGTGVGIDEWVTWLQQQETRVVPPNYVEAAGHRHA